MDDVLESNSGVFVGELHGTDAIPRWFGELGCHAGVESGRLLVGVEIPSEQQSRIDAFLESDGGRAARAALIQGRFWQRDDDEQDGRASWAMLELLERLRSLRRSGLQLRVTAFDPMQSSSPADRDRRMAALWTAAIEANPGWPWVALAGNVHARPTPGLGDDPNYKTMAVHLEERGVRLVALNIRHGGGSAWVCTGGPCGPHDFPGEENADPRVERLAARDRFDGYLWVGPIEASPPAKHSSKQRFAASSASP